MVARFEQIWAVKTDTITLNIHKGTIFMIDLKKLIDNHVQFGHKSSTRHPGMEPFIWGRRNDIYLIDVSKTANQLEKAAEFLKNTAAAGKSILLVGTKKAAQPAIGKMAKELGVPYVTHRWIGGTLTNYRQIKKAVANYLHQIDILAKSEQLQYTKKELGKMQKNVERLQKNIGGITKLVWPVGAIVVIDVKKEHVAVKEANFVGVPVVALVDTNCDPRGIDYVIPANDDSPRSINFLMDYLSAGIKQGLEAAQVKAQEDNLPAEITAEEIKAASGLESGDTEESRKRAIKAPKKQVIVNKSGKPNKKAE